MSTTMDDIKRWFLEGKKEKATHLIVVCDTFDYEDYPVYVKEGQDPKKRVTAINGQSMQKVMEVYNLSQDMDTQLKTRRNWNY